MDEEIKAAISRYINNIILEVKVRPELWDSSTEEYKNRELRDSGWKAVCTKIFDDFECREAEEQEYILRKITAKWRTVRDGYRRSQKQGFKSSSTLNTRHKLLSFLDKSSGSRSPSPETMWVVPEPVTIQPKMERVEPQSPKNYITVPVRTVPITTATPVKRSSSADNDDDVAFLKSCLPAIRSLNQQQKLRLRINFMDMIQKMLEEKDAPRQDPPKAKRKRTETSKRRSGSSDLDFEYP